MQQLIEDSMHSHDMVRGSCVYSALRKGARSQRQVLGTFDHCFLSAANTSAALTASRNGIPPSDLYGIPLLPSFGDSRQANAGNAVDQFFSIPKSHAYEVLPKCHEEEEGQQSLSDPMGSAQGSEFCDLRQTVDLTDSYPPAAGPWGDTVDFCDKNTLACCFEKLESYANPLISAGRFAWGWAPDPLLHDVIPKHKDAFSEVSQTFNDLHFTGDMVFGGVSEYRYAKTSNSNCVPTVSSTTEIQPRIEASDTSFSKFTPSVASIVAESVSLPNPFLIHKTLRPNAVTISDDLEFEEASYGSDDLESEIYDGAEGCASDAFQSALCFVNMGGLNIRCSVSTRASIDSSAAVCPNKEPTSFCVEKKTLF